jgi:hypothetical protein
VHEPISEVAESTPEAPARTSETNHHTAADGHTAADNESYTAADVDAAVEALGEPGRLAHAQEVVTHAAPALQRVLAEALSEGGWFEGAHNAEVQRVASEPDLQERSRAVDVFVAEQTRLGMFVGVAVGFQLAHELQRLRQSDVETHSDATEYPETPPSTPDRDRSL